MAEIATTIDVRKYKERIIEDIISLPNIISGIDSKNTAVDSNSPETLIYKNIFPYLKIPETQTPADAYVLFALDIFNINKRNSTLVDLVIRVWVMAHQERMEMANHSSTRIDYLGEELREFFDGNAKYGFGMLELNSSREIVLNEKYQYRELLFQTVDLKASAERKVWGR